MSKRARKNPEKPVKMLERAGKNPENPERQGEAVQWRDRDDDDYDWRVERIVKLMRYPYHTLRCPGFHSFRLVHRNRLRRLLRVLISRRRWREACGVLSVYLHCSSHDSRPSNHRFKYTIAMELYRHLESDPDKYSSKIEKLFNAWRSCSRMSMHHGRNHKDKYILLEYITSLVARNKLKAAVSTLPSLKLEVDCGDDPMFNLVIGLTYFEDWWSALQEKMRLRNLNDFFISSESETSGSSGVMDSVESEDADSIVEAYSNLHYSSETSVVIRKKGEAYFRQSVNRQAPEACANPQVTSQGSVDTSEASGECVEKPDDQILHASALNFRALQSLLPLKMPFSREVEDLLAEELSSTSYEHAVSYLDSALNSEPPISEAALLPMIQLKLLGGKVNEVFILLEKFCKESRSVRPHRWRAIMQESFGAKNYNKLSSCFEDVIKIDPTCRHSLKRLIDLHGRGEYATKSLIEMISQHLEGTFGDHFTWSEFASCLLKISRSEEDTMSMCRNGDEVKIEPRSTVHSPSIPVMFLEGMSGKTWKLRAKWWLDRHFSKHVLVSEVEKGDWKLMAYKAACAAHLYGKGLMYVVRVHECLKEHDDSLLSFLCTHMGSSVGFISKFVKK